ncbi:MAG: dihydropteroate synthase [Bacteroidota bacterium]
MLHAQTTLNCKGFLLDLSTPIVMGILNVTPDSFYDGGKYQKDTAILRQVEKMLEEGAAIIDIGGMSSRPGAEIISVDEELGRVIPVVTAIHREFPAALLSVDTIRGKVAKTAVEAGAHLINDISAGRLDESMYPTIAELKVPYILMHMKGQPKTMQQQTQYQDLVEEILDFLIAEVGKLKTMGIVDIVIDPGFGFGKTVGQNFELLKKMHVFHILGLPILAGLSRKSMIYKSLNITAADALNGTTALNMVALQQGARILRVHDVQAAVETIKLWQQLER